MDTEHREVIIVGSGPAGTTCAQRLAEENIDVLILERRAIVGNPAQCGECIPNWGEVVGTFHGIDDHEWIKESFNFPDRVQLHRLDHMRVFLPSGKSYNFDLDAFAGHRLQFDGYLAEKAINAGLRSTFPRFKPLGINRKTGIEIVYHSPIEMRISRREIAETKLLVGRDYSISVRVDEL